MGGDRGRTAVACAAFFLVVAQLFFPVRSFFSPYGRPPMDAYAVQDLSTVLNGARRLGADLAYIQLMQYYGNSPEEAEAAFAPSSPTSSSAEVHDHGHAHSGEEESSPVPLTKSLGYYSRLADFARRSVALDPFFHYVPQMAAGALGFNLNRVDDAVALLKDAAAADPAYGRYGQYIGALAYQKINDVEKVLPWLEAAIASPDASSMLKNITANIYEKRGNYRRAAEIYLDLLNTSRDESYANTAARELKRFEERGFLRLARPLPAR